MSGFREYIEIDPDSSNVELVEAERAVNDNGTISVGREHAGKTFEKIILIEDADLAGDS